MSDQPIAEHAMLSDCHSAALVDRQGSIEWWCPLRFDEPSVFGRLLDPAAGHFSLTPRHIEAVEREYLDDSLILRTVFITDSGRIEMTEALAMAEGIRGHDLGLGSPQVLLRSLRGLEGRVVVEMDFAPRPEYGLTSPLMLSHDHGLLARAGPISLLLSTTTDVEINGSTATATLQLEEGEATALAVQATSSWQPIPEPWAAERIMARLDDTHEAWRSWSRDHQAYRGPYQEEVAHSGRVLQGLTYRPTGAMVAAPTTSLPEVIGGERNWDYRFCWIRDAAFTLRALWVAACPDEAGDYLDYLTTSASSAHERDQVQIVFGVDGRRDLSERVIPWLGGWRSSVPVRVGNAAWSQVQHDVYGEVLSAVHRLRSQITEPSPSVRKLLELMADRAAVVWETPDHGIWEIRDDPRHYLHSKVMCWVALDRALDLDDHLGSPDRRARWAEARDTIHQAILDQGWNEDAAAFTQSFGSIELDASALLIPIVGVLPFQDPRVGATVEAIRRDLVDQRGLVLRYKADDGLDGDEGTFLLCTFWLAEALAGMGEIDEAVEIFENATSHANHVGLLSEEIDSATGELIGNFPQAFSHVGLINAAWAISRASGRH